MSFREKQLQPNEEIILQVNQHWITLAKPFLGALLSTIILGIAAFVLGKHWSPAYYILLLLIFPYSRFGWRLIRRANEEYIITNLRIVKQEGVLSKSSFDSPLEKVNNVFHQQSFFGRIWGYGNVGLETASEQGTTQFRYIPNPVEFKNTIIAQQQTNKAKPVYVTTTPGTTLSSGQDVPALLQKLGQLRDQGLITAEEFESKKRDLLSRM